MKRSRYRTIWISDVHLGSRGCRADELSRFLKHVDCEIFYLVGDIIDFWRLKNRSHWPQDHNDVIRRILKLSKRGARIIFIPGNHDEALRQYTGTEMGGIRICLHDVHECLDGRKLLVTHGDKYDLVVKHSPLLSLIGSAAYEWLLSINRLYNRFRRWRGKPYWSLSQFIKLKVKSACLYVSRFQETILREAKVRGLDGVICGHIHKAEFIEDAEIQYFNCGDWIESFTAIVEHHNGEMELLNAHEFFREREELDLAIDGEDPSDLELHDGYSEILDEHCEVDWQLVPGRS